MGDSKRKEEKIEENMKGSRRLGEKFEKRDA